jgi:hypothetical protein
MTHRTLAAALLVLLLPPASAQKGQDLTVQEQRHQVVPVSSAEGRIAVRVLKVTAKPVATDSVAVQASR